MRRSAASTDNPSSVDASKRWHHSARLRAVTAASLTNLARWRQPSQPSQAAFARPSRPGIVMLGEYVDL